MKVIAELPKKLADLIGIKSNGRPRRRCEVVIIREDVRCARESQQTDDGCRYIRITHPWHHIFTGKVNIIQSGCPIRDLQRTVPQEVLQRGGWNFRNK